MPSNGSLGHHPPTGVILPSTATADDYADSITDGRRRANRWLYAAAQRYQRDRARDDIYLDQDLLEDLASFVGSLQLLGEWHGQPLMLHPWQTWVLANVYCWRYREDGLRRIRSGLVQVARGNGKTTLMAGLALYELCRVPGSRGYAIANKREQARLLIDSARMMLGERLETEFAGEALKDGLRRRDADALLEALPSLPRSLDGLTPSLFVADEAAEYRDDMLEKLTTAQAKRKEALGVIISTPGDNETNYYARRVGEARAVLLGEIENDTQFSALYGIENDDDPADEDTWQKGNPGLEHGQPYLKSLRQSWATMRRSSVERGKFVRYHLARQTDGDGSSWLNMDLYPTAAVDRATLRGRQAYIGIDLSKSLDMTAVVAAVPLDDGRVALLGHYWWPEADLRERALSYRLPLSEWVADGWLRLTPGREIDYAAVAKLVEQLHGEFDVKKTVFDRWGATDVVNRLAAASIPVEQYSMGISVVGPGAQLFQQLYAGGKLVPGADPILKSACRHAVARTDINGNVRPSKPPEHKHTTHIDALMAAVMAVHAWGGAIRSCYEDW